MTVTHFVTTVLNALHDYERAKKGEQPLNRTTPEWQRDFIRFLQQYKEKPNGQGRSSADR